VSATFSSHTASEHAVSIVKAALESGAIKLFGPSHVTRTPDEMGEQDAKYLAALVNHLAAAITAKPQ
jgi:hypothetical protein